MKAIITIFVCIACLCAGCSGVKHTTDRTYMHTDTLRIALHDTITQQRDSISTLYIHDTIIKTAAYSHTDTFYITRPGTWQHTTGNLHSTVTIDTTGRIIVTCNTDSLQLVIRNLVERNTSLHDSLDHATTSTHDASNMTYADVYEKVKKTRLPWWVWALLGTGAVAEIIYLGYRLYKKYKV